MEVDEDLYTLKINRKGKRTIGKANKGINVEKIIIGLKIKKKKGRERGKKENSSELQKLNIRQRFITIIKNVTEGGKKLKSLIGLHTANKINNYNREGEKKKKSPKESTEQVKT